MRAALRTLALLAALGAPAEAAQLASGEFLNLPVDVRSLGMAEASQALASGVSAVATNPAAINEVKAQQFYFTHSFLLAGVGADYLSYGLAAGAHRFGLSYQHVGYGALEGHDASGAATGNFGPTDTAYGFTYGTRAGGLALGGSFKYIDSKIVTSAQTTTFDLGATYRLGDEWRLGASAENLSGGLKYDAESFPLPAKVAAGVGWHALEDWWLDVDVVHPLYAPSYAALGTEYALPVAELGLLSFRLGINTKTPDLGAFGSLKAGLGFQFRDLDFDYAFSAGGDLGDAHHLGVSYRFGKAKEVAP